MIICEKYVKKEKDNITNYKKLTDVKDTWKSLFGSIISINDVVVEGKKMVMIISEKKKEKAVLLYRKKDMVKKKK